MSAEYLKVILDIVILAGLGGFMYYALRLSKALNAFRTYRNEFENVMQQLSRHIDQAQRAIDELKSSSQNAGRDLKKLVTDAQFLADDLQMINETGNNLATRLEGLAEKNSRIAQEDNIARMPKQKKAKPEQDEDFYIHDREYEDDSETFSAGDADEPDTALVNLSSEAERELYQALKKTGAVKKRKA